MSAPATIAAGFLLLFSLSQGAAALDPAPGQVGRVSVVKGEVRISYGEDSDAWEAATVNFPVAAGARISAGAAGRAEINFGPHSVRLSEALLDFVALEDQLVQLRLDEGALHLALREFTRDSRFELATPFASVSIRAAGSYRVDADPAGSTRVSVWSGEALIRSDAGETLLKPGRGVDASEEGLFEFDAAMADAPDDFDRWSRDRDAQASAGHSGNVPREVTGYEELERSGTWSSYSGYGTAWTPGSDYDWWAPYTYGHWAWVPPWGWTWVDQAPWAFATFRYGSWTFLQGRWWWIPGTLWSRPVLSAFVPFHPGQVIFTTSFFVHGKPAHHFVPLKPKKLLAVKRPWPAHGSWRKGEAVHSHRAAASPAAPSPVTPAIAAPGISAPVLPGRGRAAAGFMQRPAEPGARPAAARGFNFPGPAAQGPFRMPDTQPGLTRGVRGAASSGAAAGAIPRADPAPGASGEAPARGQIRPGFGRGGRGAGAGPALDRGRAQWGASAVTVDRPSFPAAMGGVTRGEATVPFHRGGGRGDSAWRGQRRLPGVAPAPGNPRLPAAGAWRGGGARR